MTDSDDRDVEVALLGARSATPTERERVEGRTIAFFQPLTHAVARSYRHRGAEVDDLEQVADLAALKAARRFDPTLGSLRPYVRTTVHGEIRRHFRDLVWRVRPPRHVQDLQQRVMEAVEVPRGPDVETATGVAASLGIARDLVVEVLLARGGFRCLSLDHPGAGAPVAETTADVEDSFDQVDRRAFMAYVCASLDDDARHLIHLRFVEGLSQSRIAARTHSTQKQVSRTLLHVLAEMRERADLDEAV